MDDQVSTLNVNGVGAELTVAVQNSNYQKIQEETPCVSE